MALDDKQIKSIVEAALYAAEGTLNVERLLGLFIEDGTRPTREQINKALEELREDYRGRGVQLKEVSTGFRFQVDQDLAPWVSRLWEEKPPRYSRALLETLALIAYRQPITRAEIEEIRGVSVSSTIVKTLLERDWVKVVGHKEVPGRPALYSTTRAFLDYFNLKSLNELPSLAELKELDNVTGELDLEGEGEQGSGEGESAADAAAALAGQVQADLGGDSDTADHDSEAAADDDNNNDGGADEADQEQATAADSDESGAEAGPVSAQAAMKEATEDASIGDSAATLDDAGDTAAVQGASEDGGDEGLMHADDAGDDEDHDGRDIDPQELAMALGDEEEMQLPAGSDEGGNSEMHSRSD